MAKREEILRVALEVFGADGYGNTSLREIARRCGLTTAGLLHHFETKEHLLVEVLRSRDSEAREAFREEAGRLGYEAAFRNSFRRSTETPGLIALFVALASESTVKGHPAAEFFHNRYTRLKGFIEGYVQAAGWEPRNGLGHDQAATLAISVLDGVQFQWLVNPDIDLVETIKDGMSAVYQPQRAPENPLPEVD